MNGLKILLGSVCIGMIMSCEAQTSKKKTEENSSEKEIATVEREPHRYGGWHCPDNFGFEPVNLQELDQVPAVSNRLPTQEELDKHMSLIKVDLEKHPDAKALEMELPLVARIHMNHTGIDELIIVIQAIVVNEDTVVGYRYANGGNGSAWLNDVQFLDQTEVDDLGSMPFYYSKTKIKASKQEIWQAFTQTAYAKQLGETFEQKKFFSSAWNDDARVRLKADRSGEKGLGFVGIHFGNLYMHIDYDRNGVHYSEKILMLEQADLGYTEFYLASGPFPADYKNQASIWQELVDQIQKNAEK